MYIELIYTSNKGLEPLLRTLAYIINTPTITSAATLSTALSNAGIFSSDIGLGFDAANSEIIRTVGLSTTTAHIAKTAIANTIQFTLQQAVYDSPSTYYYTQLKNTVADGASTLLQGDALTGGTMASSQLVQTQTAATATAGGSILTLTNSSTDYAAGFCTAATAAWKTMSCYITDKCFLIGFSSASGASGIPWGSVYNNISTASGIFVGQYTRLDHWNTAANGIIPVAASRMIDTYAGIFGRDAAYNATAVLIDGSTAAIGSQVQPLKVLNMISIGSGAQGQNNTGIWTKDYHRSVAVSLGAHRTNEAQSLSVANTAVSTGNNSYYSYTPYLSTIANSKVPNSANTGMAYTLYPLCWVNSNYGAFGGGNISEHCGFYIYNGEFSPGDEFSYNSKTYTIWPTNVSHVTYRTGIAVPKE